MSVVSKLGSLIDQHSGEGTFENFAKRFKVTNLNHLRLPCLNQSNQPWRQSSLDELNKDLANTQAIKITNSSQHSQTLSIHENFSSKIQTVYDAFEVFIQGTAHSNALGDFRKNPSYYYPILKGSPYLFFHGDGNCVLLSLLFSHFANHFASSKPTPFYCCGASREFMHVFTRMQIEEGLHFFDPDQKFHCLNHQVDQHYSPGLIFQLLGKGGYHQYQRLVDEDFGFYTMTDDHLSEFNVSPNAYIYEPAPDKQDFASLFKAARQNLEETVDLSVSDYSWKENYRMEAQRHNHPSIHFMRDWSAIDITMPAHSQLSIGLSSIGSSSDGERLANELAAVFFGRIPMVLRLDLPADQRKSICLPFRPWLAYTSDPGVVRMKAANGQQLEVSSSVVNMQQLEALFDTGNTLDIECSSTKNTTLELYFPFNGLALNHQLLAFKLNHSMELYTRH